MLFNKKDKKELENVTSDEDLELAEEDLEEVSGGTGLRNVQKVETTDISENTLKKV